jgi:hypothetical protein
MGCDAVGACSRLSLAAAPAKRPSIIAGIEDNRWNQEWNSLEEEMICFATSVQ